VDVDVDVDVVPDVVVVAVVFVDGAAAGAAPCATRKGLSAALAPVASVRNGS